MSQRHAVAAFKAQLKSDWNNWFILWFYRLQWYHRPTKDEYVSIKTNATSLRVGTDKFQTNRWYLELHDISFVLELMKFLNLILTRVWHDDKSNADARVERAVGLE